MKKMLIDAAEKESVRVAITKDSSLIDYESEKIINERIKGNIYLAKIMRVEPSLQAAFVDYGGNRHGFLAYNEIHPDYFKIPTADKKKLLEQELENTKNLQIDDDDDDDDDSENELSEPLQDFSEETLKKNTNGKGFLDKVFDFFNYKPIEDFNSPKIRKKNRRFKNKEKPKHVIFHRKYSIQEVIKSNQVILIQVVKEERGNKGAAVTTRLSLAGKYCVLMPNTNKGGGISRKIMDVKLRKKLKDIVDKLNIKSGMGVIVRTAGQVMGLKEIKRDYGSLIKLWNEITSKTIKSNAPCLIHEEDNIIKRSLRDYFDSSFDEIIINDKETLKKSKEFVKQFMPSSIKSLKLYKEKKPLFITHKIESKIMDINNPIVHLKSGGYLVINQTEALVAIDINSGRYTKQRNIEDTAFKTNLEAAEEITKQLRIRDLAGLIVIDFIDMLERNHNIKVERRLREHIKNDRARVQVGRISNFGLMEISRQRLKVTTDTMMSSTCRFCNGYGSIISKEFLIEQLIRVCNEYLNHKKINELYLVLNKNMLDNMLKNLNLKKVAIKKLKILNFEKLSDHEYVICSREEIYHKNCHENLEIDSLQEIIKNRGKRSDENRLDSEANSNLLKKNENNKKPIKGMKKVEDKYNSENSEVSLKRKSFREKAKEFNSSDTKIKKSSKKPKQKVAILTKKKDDQKRQGWWSQ